MLAPVPVTGLTVDLRRADWPGLLLVLALGVEAAGRVVGGGVLAAVHVQHRVHAPAHPILLLLRVLQL